MGPRKIEDRANKIKGVHIIEITRNIIEHRQEKEGGGRMIMNRVMSRVRAE